MSRWFNRVGTCLIICCLGAAPSLAWSRVARPNDLAVALGIALFIALYSIIVCSAAFERAWRNQRLRRAIRIGYTVRLAISIVFPIGMFLDLFCGLITARLTGIDVAGRAITFYPSLVATVIQGVLLHVMLATFIGLVYLVLSAAPAPRRPRGFDVIMQSPEPCPVKPTC